MLTLLATPKGIRALLRWVLPLAVLTSLVCLSIGLLYALWWSPPDYQQGDSVRIMYLHVPAAYVALIAYAALALFSLVFLVWRLPMAQLLAEAVAPVGAVFTLLCLITGSFWGKPIWGTWWVWDARLTSVLILFFLYIGYIALLNAFPKRQQGQKPAAIIAVIGAINLPIIKFSVDWWNTLHQPASLLRGDGIAIDPSMLVPLLWMLVAFTAVFVTVCSLRIDMALHLKKY